MSGTNTSPLPECIAATDNDLWRQTFDAIPDLIAILDLQHRVCRVNRALAERMGLSPEACIGLPCCQLLHGQETPGTDCPHVQMLADLQEHCAEVHDDRTGSDYLITVTPRFDAHGQLTGSVHVARDITATKRLEGQIAQAQKMDALGRLAGGVAHDFNNIVQVILGFSDLVLMDMSAEHPHRPDLEEIKRTALRAGEISRRLLSFSRRQTVAPIALDLNTVVPETLKMLQSLLGADIRIFTRFEPGLNRIFADSGQIAQVVMNLAVNARDAMPHGGRLAISTSSATIAPQNTAMLALPGAQPGEFVCLTIADNGTGMSDIVRAHLFEPFFTTKANGKGTGLGLSVVGGIVKQCDGWIHVDSHPESGTTFRLYFPVHDGRRSTTVESPGSDVVVAPSLRGKHECILLVEDDPAVCLLAVKMLSAAQYRVVACATAQEARALFQDPSQRFDLLFSDVVLPDHTGLVLADELRAIRPRLPVLLCSGYTDERSRLTLINEKGYLFLQKPYSATGLLHIIRLLLDARTPSA